ncbi:GNAT family N-acetyltransferase [Pandoraea sputorum]|uniref:GNAT family N-acetyltransferase n=1 Tax=Pandoraea sputorum TaxID=93222 RepID=UPI001E5F54C0|nr:GNAT family N-acetyltransferase [Pandoraea sputorum]MCE4062990.1 GNAT family N-acetyltransferase [Pandoraea sputorum]
MTGRQIVIAPATAADLPTLARIYYEVRLATMTWVDPSLYRADDFASHAAGEDVLTAKSSDGKILGFISVWPADDFIHMLYVEPSSQGHGVGTRLLQALPGWPARRYRLKCLIRNTRAKTFYERHGFRVIGKGVSEEGAFEEMSNADCPRKSSEASDFR